jgi:ferredoxin
MTRTAGNHPMLTANRDRCIGSGQCVRLAPDLFDSDDEGLVTLVCPSAGVRRDQAPVDGARRDQVPLDDARLGIAREAVRLCPAQALAVRDGGAPATRATNRP